ncbi:MAG: hypothetical protein JOZ41_05145 [Chloroflexi bacterium]|nr:hypothetical protein [Chloroflexota bacterium]
MATWVTDRHSLSYAAIRGTYTTTSVVDEYRISGVEVRDNATQSPVAGGLTAIITGTLVNFVYNGTGFDLAGYSKGTISCSTGRTSTSGPGRQSWGFNQVFANS